MIPESPAELEVSIRSQIGHDNPVSYRFASMQPSKQVNVERRSWFPQFGQKIRLRSQRRESVVVFDLHPTGCPFGLSTKA